MNEASLHISVWLNELILQRSSQALYCSIIKVILCKIQEGTHERETLVERSSQPLYCNFSTGICM